MSYKSNRSSAKMIAAVLGVTTIAACVSPIGAFAKELPKFEAPSLVIETTGAVPLPGLSNRYSNTVQNADGSYTMEYSSAPVNYRSDTGLWEPIDNDLVPMEGADYLATNAANEFKFEIPRDPSSSPVRFEIDDQWLTMLSLGADADVPEVDGTQVTFDDVERGAEYTYEVRESGVKEDIVLSKPPVRPVSFSYLLRTSSGLTPILNDIGGVTFKGSDGSTAFSIPPGVMSDSSDAGGGYSDAVKFKLTPVESGWRFTLTPDFSWLTAPDRKYPVAIDPTIDISALKDCWLQEDTPNTSRCNSDYIRVGKYGGATGRRRGLIDLGISTIPTNATVTNAQLYTWLDANMTTGSGTPNFVWHRASSWSASATWSRNGQGNSWSAGNPSDYASQAVALDGNTSQWVGWDLRGATANWRSGSWSRDGLVLVQMGESSSKTLGFVSANNSIAGFRPIYRVDYTLPAPSAAPPSAPRGLTYSPCEVNPCASSGTVTSVTPTLFASSTDSDTSSLLYSWQIKSPSGSLITSGTSTEAQGSLTSWTVPSGFLVNGGAYVVTVGASDNSGNTWYWSAGKNLTVNLSRPTEVPVITGTTLNDLIPSVSESSGMVRIVLQEHAGGGWATLSTAVRGGPNAGSRVRAALQNAINSTSPVADENDPADASAADDAAMSGLVSKIQDGSAAVSQLVVTPSEVARFATVIDTAQPRQGDPSVQGSATEDEAAAASCDRNARWTPFSKKILAYDRYNPVTEASYGYMSFKFYWSAETFADMTCGRPSLAYEHDFKTNNYDGQHLFYESDCFLSVPPLTDCSNLATFSTNMPRAYLDTNFKDHDEELYYSVGTWDVLSLSPVKKYWIRAGTGLGNTTSDTAALQGELGIRVPPSCHSAWCIPSLEIKAIIPAWDIILPKRPGAII